MSALAAAEELYQVLDERTLAILEHRRGATGRKGRGWLMRRMLLASDLLGLGIAFAAAQLIFGARPGQAGALSDSLLFAVALPFWVVTAKVGGLYARDEERADHSTADDVIGVFQLVTVGAWLLYVAAMVSGLAHPALPKLATFWAIAVVAVPVIRGIARSRCRRRIEYIQNTLVIGAGEVGQQIARKVLKHPEYGLNLVGFVDGVPKERGHGLEHLALLGGLEDVIALVEMLDIERVIVAFSNDDVADLVGLVRELNAVGVQVDVVPRFFDVLSPSIAIHSVEGIPLLGLRPPRLSRSEQLLKRTLDVFGAVSGLVVLTPAFAAIAAAIKLESSGPVFFRQVRMGAGDRTFRIVKFRTMAADADARKADVAHLNKHARNGGDPRMFKIDDDPRVTRLGRVLRRFSLDELPQLWNVLVGEMSLVGPRPLILDEHAYVTDWAERRLDLRPGVTGLWQVLGADDIPFGEMVRLDYMYVSGWSLAGDLRLILRTLPVPIRRSRRGPALQ